MENCYVFEASQNLVFGGLSGEGVLERLLGWPKRVLAEAFL
jgi:hypothetical protein